MFNARYQTRINLSERNFGARIGVFATPPSIGYDSWQVLQQPLTLPLEQRPYGATFMARQTTVAPLRALS